MAARSDQALRRVSAALLAQVDAMVPETHEVQMGHGRLRAGLALVLLTDALQTLSQPTTMRPESFSDHLRHRQGAQQTITEIGQDAVGADSTEALVRQARRLHADLSSELSAGALPACVESLFGVARTTDYIRGALLDAVAVSLRHRFHVVHPAMVESCRALSAALGERFPGAVIELRVPPASAVQLGAMGSGPTHTRGTPPNVVETDMETMVRLGTGLLSWPEALTSGAVRASGSHVDALAHMLPVINAPALP